MYACTYETLAELLQKKKDKTVLKVKFYKFTDYMEQIIILKINIGCKVQKKRGNNHG